MGTERSAIAQQFISDEVCKALHRAGLPHNSPIHAVLDKDAQITGTREPTVRTIDESGGSTSLDDRIQELRGDPRYRSSFPAQPPKVARTDMAKLRENFSAIADGKVAVE